MSLQQDARDAFDVARGLKSRPSPSRPEHRAGQVIGAKQPTGPIQKIAKHLSEGLVIEIKQFGRNRFAVLLDLMKYDAGTLI